MSLVSSMAESDCIFEGMIDEDSRDADKYVWDIEGFFSSCLVPFRF